MQDAMVHLHTVQNVEGSAGRRRQVLMFFCALLFTLLFLLLAQTQLGSLQLAVQVQYACRKPEEESTTVTSGESPDLEFPFRRVLPACEVGCEVSSK